MPMTIRRNASAATARTFERIASPLFTLSEKPDLTEPHPIDPSIGSRAAPATSPRWAFRREASHAAAGGQSRDSQSTQLNQENPGRQGAGRESPPGFWGRAPSTARSGWTFLSRGSSTSRPTSPQPPGTAVAGLPRRGGPFTVDGGSGMPPGRSPGDGRCQSGFPPRSRIIRDRTPWDRSAPMGGRP